MATHLLIETGRASRLAACDEPFANGQPGTEVLSDVTCAACRALFPAVYLAEPTPDQSYCDVGRHQQCSGYTEDEADPETCMCPCHDLAEPDA